MHIIIIMSLDKRTFQLKTTDILLHRNVVAIYQNCLLDKPFVVMTHAFLLKQELYISISLLSEDRFMICLKV